MFEEITNLTKQDFFQQYEKVLPKITELLSDPFIRNEASTQKYLEMYEAIKMEQNTDTTKPFNTLSNKILYTWLKLLDNEIAVEEKHQWCQQLMSIDKNVARLIMKQPTIMLVHFLSYANPQDIYSLFDSQFKYRLSNEWRIDYFQAATNLIIQSRAISKSDKAKFFNNLFGFLDYLTEKAKAQFWSTFYDCTEQAMACWLYYQNDTTENAYLTLREVLAPEKVVFLDTMQTKALAFKNHITSQINSLRVDIREHTVLYQLKMCFEKSDPNFIKKLFCITRHISDEKSLDIFCDVMNRANKKSVTLLQNHIEQVALQEYVDKHFSGLFFSSVLPFVTKRLSSIELDLFKSKLSQNFTPSMFINLTKYLKENNYINDILLYWSKNDDARLIATIQLGLSYSTKQDSYHESAQRLMSDICNHPKVADILALLHANLSLTELIGVFTLASPQMQSFIFSIIFSEINSIEEVKEIDDAIKTSLYPAKAQKRMLELLAEQSTTIDPTLETQIKQAGLFGLTQEDPVLRDIETLKKLLENTRLTHNEKRSEVHQLSALNSALSNDLSRHSTLKTMFSMVACNQWPQLFVYYDTEIIHWHIAKDVDAPKTQQSWLIDLPLWSNILIETMKAISINEFERYDILTSIGDWSLREVQVALAKTSKHVENYGAKLLKAMGSVDIAILMPVLLKIKSDSIDKYDNDSKFVVNDEMISSFLPENKKDRTAFLSRLFCSRTNKIRHLSEFIKAPYIRNEDEEEALVKKIYQDQKDSLITIMLSPFRFGHRQIVLKHLFANYPWEIRQRLLGEVLLIIKECSAERAFELILQIAKDFNSQGYNAKELFQQSPQAESIFSLLENKELWKEDEDDLPLLVDLHRTLNADNFYLYAAQKIKDTHQKYFSHFGLAMRIDEINKTKYSSEKSFGAFVAENEAIKKYLTQLIEKNIAKFVDHNGAAIKLLSCLKTFMPNLDEKIICAMDKFVEDHTDDAGDHLNKYDAKKLHDCLSDLISVFGRHVIQAECCAYPKLEVHLRLVLSKIQSSTSMTKCLATLHSAVDSELALMTIEDGASASLRK